MNIIEQFRGRKASPLIQFIKYGIAGGVATLVNGVLFVVCASLLFPAFDESDLAVRLLGLPAANVHEPIRALHAMTNNVIIFPFSNLAAYLINVYWVFEPGRHRRSVEIGLFLAVSAVSSIIGTGSMGFLISFFGISTTLAFGVCIVVSIMINYTMRKFVIFKG